MGVFSRKKDQTETYPPSSVPLPRSRNASPNPDVSALGDPLQIDRRRARRRLVGAIALAVGAVVFLPMIFDSEQKSTETPLSVRMPDKDSPFTPNISEPPAQGGASNSAAQPAAQSAAQPAAQPAAVPTGPAESVSGTQASPNAVAPADSAPLSSPQSATPGASSALSPGAAPPSSSSASSGNAVPLAGAKQRPQATLESSEKVDPERPNFAKPAEKDDPRAVAALEGKVIDPTPSKSAGASNAGSYAVQIGAFSTSDRVKERVKELRDKLTAAGLRTYTEDLATPQGERTRLRVGPYASRDAAEKAREKVRSAGLDGTIISP